VLYRQGAVAIEFQLLCGVGRYVVLGKGRQWPESIASLDRHIIIVTGSAGTARSAEERASPKGIEELAIRPADSVFGIGASIGWMKRALSPATLFRIAHTGWRNYPAMLRPEIAARLCGVYF
jgi:hypothetical protein